MSKSYTFLFLSLFCLDAFGSEVTDANLSLELYTHAQRAGLGDLQLGLNPHVQNTAIHPSSLLGLDQSYLAFTHREHYLGANFDFISWNKPLDSNTAIGLHMARYGIDGIYRTREGELYQGLPTETFGIADYLFSYSYARRWLEHLQAGFTAHLLYRQLDQQGVGMRIDLSGDWEYMPYQQIHVLVKGISTSAARWESSVIEGSRPEFYTGWSYLKQSPYFYGDFKFTWNSAEWFLKKSRTQGLEFKDLNLSDTSTEAFTSAALWDSPGQWFFSSGLAIEYLLNWGGRFRLGMNRIREYQMWSAGAGLQLGKGFAIDYGLQRHHALGRVHTIGITFSMDLLNKGADWLSSGFSPTSPLVPGEFQKAKNRNELTREMNRDTLPESVIPELNLEKDQAENQNRSDSIVFEKQIIEEIIPESFEGSKELNVPEGQKPLIDSGIPQEGPVDAEVIPEELYEEEILLE